MIPAAPLITYRSTVAKLVGWLCFAALCLAVFTGFLGWRYGAAHATALGQADLATAARDAAVHQAESSQRALSRYRAQVEQANQLAQAVIDHRVQIEQLRLQLQRRASHVTTIYRPAPSAEPVPIPRTVFTAGFVRDWNAAFGLPAEPAGTDAASPGQQAGQAGTAGSGLWADELADSGVTQLDLLQHAIDVGTWCQQIEQQRDRLTEFKAAE